MKKFLLLGAAALMVASASAQVKRSATTTVNNAPKVERLNLNYVTKEAKVANGAIAPALRAPKKANYIEPFYYRPAGAYYSPMIAVGGAGGYSYGNDFVFFKPYTDYFFRTFVDGADENTTYTWDVFHGYQGDYEAVDGKDINIQYTLSTQDMPMFYAIDGDIDDASAAWYQYQMTDYTMGGTQDAPTITSQQPVQAWAIPEPSVITDEEGIDFLLTSKSTVPGGRNANLRYTWTAYYGATSYDGLSDQGWWFGKNGEHIDGMAQVFEKPTKPYVLKKVYMMMSDDLMCDAPVKLTCKVYRLDEVPAYNDSMAVGLPIVPGDLIVTGEGYVTPQTGTDKNGFVEFTLYGVDEDDPELTYEYAPTVDYPIMVVVDGYNDPEAEDLIDFTAYISADDEVDEGYGELAYLKYPRYVVEINENGDTVKDEEGNPVYDFTGEYYWRGLNNFFRSGTMKTALSIFIVADQPFVIFNYSFEDGEHTFPNEGGVMQQIIEVEGEEYMAEGISFWSWVSSEDGDWTLTCNGKDELPDWLHIELSDVEQEEEILGYEVQADVTADPLPAGLAGREAIVRFEIPGDYIEYKFIQGDPIPPVNPYDVNRDGSVNIADINLVIDIILSGTFNANGDVNEDGSVNISDINEVIAYILSH